MGRYSLPKGFLASGVHCGIKRFKKDLTLIYSRTGCKAAALFTKNKVKAAPLLVSKSVLANARPIRAIIVNSGNANCCTGWYGARDAKRMINAVCKNMPLKFNNVLVSSTGIIGQRLQVELIEGAVPKLVKLLSEKGLMSAAKGILTTDRRVKIAVEKFNIGQKQVTVSGFAKGAGMVHPNMATLLSFVMTDAKIDKDALKSALKEACDESFNAITVDGDMSTNDTLTIMANGLAGNKNIKRKTREYAVFLKALKTVMFKLAKGIVEDAEGATKFVTVHVKSAGSVKDAQKVARAVATSCLVKTSLYGENPNWGRIASATGASGVQNIKPKKIEIHLDGVSVFKGGRFVGHSKEKLHRLYKKKNIVITVSLNRGNKEAKIWTCDLSKRYVEINSHYMT
ncbi:bifunctional glutamate N-acetyltransferase/amino-acid acetyltransferase ArgJ [Candidatus Omnitrophota bacterium]